MTNRLNHSKPRSEILRITQLKNGFQPIDLNTTRKRLKIERDDTLSVKDKIGVLFWHYTQIWRPLFALKLPILGQSIITVFLFVGLGASLSKNLMMLLSKEILSVRILNESGYWASLIGHFYFVYILLTQWSFGALQDHTLIKLIFFITVMAYLIFIKFALPIKEHQIQLIQRLCMTSLLCMTYILSYSISYPWTTLICFEGILIEYVLWDFLNMGASQMLNDNMAMIVHNPENLDQLMLINMQGILDANEEAAAQLR